MIRDIKDLAMFAADVEEHYGDIRRYMEGEGAHLAVLAEEDQLEALLTDAGWSERAIGAYLMVYSMVAGGDVPNDCCPASLMVAALYSKEGKVTA